MIHCTVQCKSLLHITGHHFKNIPKVFDVTMFWMKKEGWRMPGREEFWHKIKYYSTAKQYDLMIDEF